MGQLLEWCGGRRSAWRTFGVLAASWATCLALLLVSSVAGARAFPSGAGQRTAHATGSVSTFAAARPVTAGSLSASPTPAIRGEQLLFTGRVPLHVVRWVYLQRQRSGSWVTIDAGRTTATGSFRLQSATTTTCTYRVWAGQTTVSGRILAAVVTPTWQVPVVAQTAALGAPPNVSVGESITVTVTAKPVRTGRAVAVQEQDSEGDWVDVASGVEDASGTASSTLTRKTGGRWQLRGVVRAASGAQERVTAVTTWLPAGAVMELGTVDWTRTSSYGVFTATPDRLYYYADSAGNLVVVTHDPTAGALAIDTFDPSTLEHVGDTRSVSLAGWPNWGGFYAGPDGYFYVLVGCPNPNEDDTLDVVAVRRYDRDWTLVGTAYVQGGATQIWKGIYSPFAASAPHMVLVGNRLVVHMGRLLYAIEGVHHQANFTFEVDVDTMIATTFDGASGYANCGHSFQQLVAMNGGNLVMIDHGDAYPRAIQMGVVADYPTQRRVARYDLFEFNGAIGDNFTGATVTGLVSGPSGIVVVGNSIRHPDAPHGALGPADEHRNIYAIWADPASGTHTVQWLTDFAPQGADSALEPRVVQVAPDRYAVLFSVRNDSGYRMEYRLIDSAGAVLTSASFPGVFF